MDDDRDRPVASLVRDPPPDPESVGEDEVLVERIRAEITTAGRSRSPGSWPAPCTSRGTATTGGPTRPRSGRRLPHRARDPSDLRRRRRPPLERGVDGLGRPCPFVVVEHGAGTGALAGGPAGRAPDAGSPARPRRSATGPIEIERRAARGAQRAARRGRPCGPRSTPATPWRTASQPPARSSRTRCSMRCRSTGSIGRPGGSASSCVGLDARAGSPGSRRAAERRPARGAPRTTRGSARGRAGHRGLPRLDDLARGRRRRPRPRARRPRRLRGGARVPVRPEAARRHPARVRPPRRRRRPVPPRRPPGPDRHRRPRRRPGRRRARGPRAGRRDHPGRAARGDEPATSPRRSSDRPGATLEDALLLRSALARLLDPRGMGGYRVLVFGRGLPAGRGAARPAPAAGARPAAAGSAPAEHAAIGRRAPSDRPSGPAPKHGTAARMLVPCCSWWRTDTPSVITLERDPSAYTERPIPRTS